MIAKLVLAVVLLGVTPLVALADAGDDQFTVAAGHYSTQRWQLAADEFRTLLADYADHPKRTKGEFFLGEALVQLGKCDEAYTHFVAVHKAEPQGRYARQSLFRAGECAVLAGKTEAAREALAAFHKLYSSDQLNAYVLNYLGELSLAAGNAAEAREYYAKAIDGYADGPTRDECRVGLSQALIQLKEYDAADELLATLVQEKHLAVEALYWRGQLYRAQQRWEAAAATLSDAIDREPEHPAAEMLRYHAADALLRANRAEPAIDLIRNRRESSAIPAAQRYLLAVAHQNLKQHDKAAELLRSLDDELEPDLAVQSQLALAASLVELAKRQEAIESLTAALATDAAKPPAARLRLLAQIALTQARGQQIESAQATLRKMLDVAPDSETTLQTVQTVADLAVKANDIAGAEQLYTLLAGHSNKQFSAKGINGLTRLAALDADPAKAALQFEELIEKYPDDPRTVAAALVRAQSLEDAKQFDAALAVYKLVIDKQPITDNLPLVLLRRTSSRRARAGGRGHPPLRANQHRLRQQRAHWRRALRLGLVPARSETNRRSARQIPFCTQGPQAKRLLGRRDLPHCPHGRATKAARRSAQTARRLDRNSPATNKNNRPCLGQRDRCRRGRNQSRREDQPARHPQPRLLPAGTSLHSFGSLGRC